MNDSRTSDRIPGVAVTEYGKFLLCVPAKWESYISREFYEIQEGLLAHGWTKLVIDEVEDSAIVASIRQAHIVFLWEAYELLERNATALCATPSLDENSARKIFFCDDIHHFTAHRREQRLRAFKWADLILATYPDKLQQWYPEIADEKIKWTPHAAASYFQPISVPSSDRVLLSGSRTWPYPFRQFCHAKLPNVICDVVDHPGYPGYPGDKANKTHADSIAMTQYGREQYAVLLRNYPAMLVCGSVFGYLVAKVFEGMATGCLVICERTSLGERLSALGFFEGEHYIGTDVLHVIEDTAAVRDAFLRGDSLCSRIIANATGKVLGQHTTTIRTEQIHRICMESIAK